MYDIYLAGSINSEWRNFFKGSISDGVKIFDPSVANFSELLPEQKDDCAAKEFTIMEEQSCIVVFYFDKNWNGHTSLLELGNIVGKGKQVFICIEDGVVAKDKILNFCDFHGVYSTSSLEDLIATVGQYFYELSSIVES